MSDRPFFDTNVLIYVLAEQDGRTTIAEELLGEGGIISVQVLNELAAVASRKLAMSWQEIGDALDAIRVPCPDPRPLTVETHGLGLQIAARYGFSIYDALLIASALEAGCTTLYSEDLQAGQDINDTLTIRNPFAGHGDPRVGA
jgi:predicted nucleic acid-binding protein